MRAAGFEQPEHEAQSLLGHLLGVGRLALYLDERWVSGPTVERFREQIRARQAGIPLQYLLKEAAFCGVPLRVRPGVFIPRPETECVVAEAVAVLRARERRLARPLRLLDLGTGSGAIAIALAQALPACVVIGVELSWDALRMASRNVEDHGLGRRIRLVQGSWAEALRGRVDGVLSNPPYIPSGQVDDLPLDVRREPHMSLDGGPDGLRVLSHLIAEGPRLLAPGGLLVVECGEAQVAELLRLGRAAPWVKRARPVLDLARRPRGVVLTRSNNLHGTPVA